jgi:hypothetical protein
MINGLLSSVFDILTFLTVRLGFHASAALSRSGWFIESTITELDVMLVLLESQRNDHITVLPLRCLRCRG